MYYSVLLVDLDASQQTHLCGWHLYDHVHVYEE